MHVEKKTFSYQPSLDGVRGIAIIAVVLYHNFNYTGFFSYGWIGVDLFFVLSGYLITSILLCKIGDKNFIAHFYARRGLRIFPLYYGSLLIFFYLLPLFKPIDGIQIYKNHQWWYFTFTQNWLMGVSLNKISPTLLHHFWSLAVEEQYYILWPITILFIKRTRRLIKLLITVLIMVNFLRFCLLLFRIENFPYATLFTFTRIDGLCAGSLLALTIEKLTPRFAVAIAFFIFFLNTFFLFLFPERFNTLPYFSYLGYTSIAILFSIIIYFLMTQKKTRLNHILENTGLVLLGKISFGLYIFHHPINIIFHDSILTKNINHFDDRTANLIASLGATMISIVVSLISFFLFERYFLNMKKKFA